MAQIPTRKTSSALTNTDSPITINLEEQIRQRAYELYEARGRGEGHDLDDWLQAEAEVAAVNTRRAAN